MLRPAWNYSSMSSRGLSTYVLNIQPLSPFLKSSKGQPPCPCAEKQHRPTVTIVGFWIQYNKIDGPPLSCLPCTLWPHTFMGEISLSFSPLQLFLLKRAASIGTHQQLPKGWERCLVPHHPLWRMQAQNALVFGLMQSHAARSSTQSRVFQQTRAEISWRENWPWTLSGCLSFLPAFLDDFQYH